MIEGVEPTFENIASGKYPISRSLYVYAKNAHLNVIPACASSWASSPATRPSALRATWPTRA
jgi:hypothetical protein